MIASVDSTMNLIGLSEMRGTVYENRRGKLYWYSVARWKGLRDDPIHRRPRKGNTEKHDESRANYAAEVSVRGRR